MSNCTKCGEKLGVFQKKYHYTDELGKSLKICKSCNQILLLENNQERLRIIKRIVKQYFEKCENLEQFSISVIYSEKDFFELVEPNSLINLITHIKNVQSLVNNKINKGDYDDLDEYMDLIEIYKYQLNFFPDLTKILKLLKSKNVQTDYLELLKLFNELKLEQENQETNLILNQEQQRITDKLLGDISVRKVVKEFIKTPIDKDITKLLLNRFNLDFKEYDLDELIEELSEEIDLEYFENNLNSSENNKILSDPSNLSGLEFEAFLKELFELLGYSVIQTKASGDQGADLILKLDNIKTVVQAKRYSGNVSNTAIQEVAAARKHYKCDKAMVVTTGKFTKSAIQLAISNEVELWDFTKLSRTINNINNSRKFGTEKYKELDLVYEKIEDEYYLKFDDSGTPEAHLNNVDSFKNLLIRLGDELSETSNMILEANDFENKPELIEYSQELVSRFNALFQIEIDTFLESLK